MTGCAALSSSLLLREGGSLCGGVIHRARLSLFFCSSFPRKRESSFCLCPSFPRALSGALNSRRAGHPVTLLFCFSLRARLPLVLWTSGSLSCQQRQESNQRNAAPGAAPSALRAPGTRGHAGVRSMDIRVHSRTRAHPARDPMGESVMPSPRLTGTQNQKTDQEPSAEGLLLALARTMRAAVASPGPHYIAAAADEKARRVGAMDRADSAIAQGCAISGTRPLTRTLRAGARRAQCSGAASFGYFSSL